MSRLTTEQWLSPRRSAWAGHLPSAERGGLDRSQKVWLAAGLVALGVGVLAWTYLGPDLKRYIKIHSM